jgi:hypothetical protein
MFLPMVGWVLNIGPESMKNFSECIHYLQESEYQMAGKNCSGKRQVTILLVLDNRLVMKISRTIQDALGIQIGHKWAHCLVPVSLKHKMFVWPLRTERRAQLQAYQKNKE